MAAATNTKNNKQPKVRGKFFRELGGELKKVTWPTFGKVVKQTGIVIIVSLFFLVIVTAIDAGLGALYQLLVTPPVA